jgi:hypothetical protein
VCMEACIDVTMTIKIKKIYKARTVVYTLLNDDTMINSSNDKIVKDVIAIDSSRTFITKDTLDGGIHKHFARYDIKDFIYDGYLHSYILTKTDSIYYVNSRSNTHTRVLNNVQHMRGWNGHILAWNDLDLHKITARTLRKTLRIYGIKDVSITAGKYSGAYSGDIAILTQNNIFLTSMHDMRIRRSINVYNIEEISLKYNVLGCMTTKGEVTIYHKDESLYVGKALGFAVTCGDKYFDCVDVVLIQP